MFWSFGLTVEGSRVYGIGGLGFRVEGFRGLGV